LASSTALISGASNLRLPNMVGASKGWARSRKSSEFQVAAQLEMENGDIIQGAARQRQRSDQSARFKVGRCQSLGASSQPMQKLFKLMIDLQAGHF